MKHLVLATAMILTAGIANASTEALIERHCNGAEAGNAFSQKIIKNNGWVCDTADTQTFAQPSSNVELMRKDMRIKELEKQVAQLQQNRKTVVKEVKVVDNTRIAQLEAEVAKLTKTNKTLQKLVDRQAKLIESPSSPARQNIKNNSVFEIDSFRTSGDYAYVELDVKKTANKISCRIKNSSGETIASDNTYFPTVGWHKQIMILPAAGISGLTVSCQAQ